MTCWMGFLNGRCLPVVWFEGSRGQLKSLSGEGNYGGSLEITLICSYDSKVSDATGWTCDKRVPGFL